MPASYILSSIEQKLLAIICLANCKVEDSSSAMCIGIVVLSTFKQTSQKLQLHVHVGMAVPKMTQTRCGVVWCGLIIHASE